MRKKDLYLDEVVPPGPHQEKDAEKVRTRLLSQVDEKRNPKTRATVDQMMTKYFSVLDADPQTIRGYRSKYETHIKPLLGSAQLARLDVETLDTFYAELRRCRIHCTGRKKDIEHRTTKPHQCDEHVGNRCPRNNPEGCRRCRRMCKPHVCKGLADSTVRQIHWILSGGLDRAVVWTWISVNPAEHADKPGLPTPNPQPPTVDEVGQLINAAFEEDEDWGRFLSTKTITGSRRGEMCALRFTDRVRRKDAKSVLKIERSIFVNDNGALEEKDTKTHQHRRVVLEPEDDAVLDEQEAAARRRAASAGVKFDPNGFIYSPVPDGSVPHHPDTVSKRFARLAHRLEIHTSLKNQRHYNATELINAGYNVRAAAGRLGHSGGGTTTLRVYTAWWSEAEQQAAGSTPVRMPRPKSSPKDEAKSVVELPSPAIEELGPYQRIAADLRGAIDSGVLAPGDALPSEKSLAARYGVAPSTAHRAVALLIAAGHVTASRGKRATVAGSDNPSIASVTELRSPSASRS
ncbi:GntR family transcriptional regulator [Kribbella pittospori]|uniref:GntR family transcriptional regulator n=1 Tax=Kribbella pittospori TaxID=722689 RepID=UPI00192E25AE|nr:GntR family transcriptional regulator [Kribbella pittospori]